MRIFRHLPGIPEAISIAYLIDTWTWIEYWKGSNKKAIKIINESPEEFSVSSITIAEIAQIYQQRDKSLITVRTDDVAQRATIVPVTFDIARLAGQLRSTEIEGGIADAIILATARITSSKIVTGDQHFKSLPDVLYLGE
ncbi:MAG: PIN domain-containing protein [Methanoregula sp.]|uniref:PIN domain-containing protein n=1 Tax=Methanoregula sp. TaxID=2052170 RepID=UPI003C279176